MKKKLLACVLSATIVACQSGLFVGADYMPKTKGTSSLIKLEGEKIDEYVKKVALGWANNTNPELKLKATDVKKVMQINSSDPEYAVSFYSGKTPYGYAVVLFKDNEATVKESVVEKNEKSVYDNLIDVVEDEKGTSEKNLDIGKKVLELAPMQYGIVADYKSEKSNPINSNIYDVYGNEIPAVQVAEENVQHYYGVYNSGSSIFISEKKWESSEYKDKSGCKLKKYQKKLLVSDDYSMSITDKYCCVVQSFLQIAILENMVDINSTKQIKSVYDKLWKSCGVDKNGSIKKEKGVSYGYAHFGKAMNAMVKFLKGKGYYRTTATKTWLPSYKWLNDKIGHNKPVVMGYAIETKNGKVSHAVTILGTYKAKKKSTGKTYSYLMVYDSYHNSPKYINYTTVDFSNNCEAMYFDIRAEAWR